MKKIMLFSMLLSLLFILSCAREGDLRLINQTNHRIFYSFENVRDTLEALETKDYNFNLGKSSFWNELTKNINIHIQGETFSLRDTLTMSEIQINQDKTTKLYLKPNHACLKIRNLSSSTIKRVKCIRHYINSDESSTGSDFYVTIPAHSETYFRIPHETTTDINNNDYFYYTYSLYTGEIDFREYGNSSQHLFLDEVYTIDFTDQ